MSGQQRLAQVNATTPRLSRALAGMPMAETTMVRLLRIAQFGLGHSCEPAFRALNLTESGFHVLCLLLASESGAAAPSELAEMVGTSRANMTRILEELVQEGWVERAIAARDGRRHVISITAAGRRKVRDAIPRLAEPVKRAFSGLSAEELAVLDKLLRKLIVSFDNGALELISAA